MRKIPAFFNEQKSKTKYYLNNRLLKSYLQKVSRKPGFYISPANLEKYRNDGWGLSLRCLADIQWYLNKIKKPVIVEFGSGYSTDFFIDYLKASDKTGHLHSFDHDPQYASKLVDDRLTLNLYPLEDCSSNDFDDMFKNRAYDKHKMRLLSGEVDVFVKNTFYQIESKDLPEQIDLVILDGHHGNGRSISFLHLVGKVKDGTIVVIDDYTHYDFVERFMQIFPKSETLKVGNYYQDFYQVMQIKL